MRYPENLSIYLDTVCNKQCWFCLYEGRGDLPSEFNIGNLDKLTKAIEKASHIVITAIGEPLLSPNLTQALKRVYELNSRKDLIAIVTNGVLLSPDIARLLNGHLADLIISVNDLNEAPTDAIGSFVESINNKDRNKLGLHLVAHTGNYNQIPKLIKLATELGISRVRVDQFQVAQEEHLPFSLLNVKKEYNLAVDEASELAHDIGVSFIARRFGVEQRVQKCPAPWIECHIWADGKVAPCCYNGTLFLGNAYETSFEDCWFGEAYKHLRKHSAPQCHSCPKILPFDDYRVHVYPYLYEKLK